MGKNPESIDDMEIFDIITALNKKPYIQTEMCCSGHPLWEERNRYSWGPWIDYHILNKDKRGPLLMEYIRDHVNQKLPDKFPRVFADIDFGRRTRLHGKYEGDTSLPENELKGAVTYFWDSVRDALNTFKEPLHLRVYYALKPQEKLYTKSKTGKIIRLS
jgi:hypothetical protein